MGSSTNIEWCDITWNIWRGCAEVSPGCANCYARTFAKRNPDVLGEWGKDAYRALASDAYLAKITQENRRASRDRVRRRVFLGSMMDFFEDRPDLVGMRELGIYSMGSCKNLDFLVLTKRPENIDRLWPMNMQTAYSIPPPNYQLMDNVWFGVSVEDVKRADERIPRLQDKDVRVRFLSVEPILEYIDLNRHLQRGGIHWVIVGGESQQEKVCRRTQVDWIEAVVAACQGNGVPVFVKQMGGLPYDGLQQLKLKSKKGEDVNEWPDHLRIRQFPTPRDWSRGQ